MRGIVLALVLLLLSGSAGATTDFTAAPPPDDPTLCGGQPIPGSYAWVDYSGITFTWRSPIVTLPYRSREERIGDFCSDANARTIGAYGPAVKEFCL